MSVFEEDRGVDRTAGGGEPSPWAVHSHADRVESNPFRDILILIGCFVAVFGGATLMAVVVWTMLPSHAAGLPPAEERPLDLVAYTRGQKLYATSCVACHGAAATGVPKLGKDLLRSKIVHRSTDAQLAELIQNGRDAKHPANTTGTPMPPKGGNPNLTQANIAEIVVYLRGLAEPLRVPAGEAPESALADLNPAPAATPAAPIVETKPATETKPSNAAAAASLDTEAITRGKKVYSSCLACHGKDGAGVKGLGKALVRSEFVDRLNDDDLLAFIKKGRGPTDADNTTKVGMPPKGGNPALNDKQLRDVITYIRSLGKAESSARKEQS